MTDPCPDPTPPPPGSPAWDQGAIAFPLGEGQQWLGPIFQYANDAIFVVDPEGDRILEANPKASTMLGYSREELLTTVKISTVHPEEMPQFLAFSTLVLAQGHGWTDELTCFTKTGQRLAAEISATAIPGEPHDYILAIVRDITERKQAQAAMARLAEIGQLSAMVAHEVRSPLTTVLMGLTALQQLDLPERAQLRLELACEEASRLKALLDKISQYAREETLEITNLDLVALVRKVGDLVSTLPVAQGRYLEMQSAWATAITPGDADKLKQVFINLLRNAFEAVAVGETIQCHITSGTEPDQIRVTIHNRGDVIPTAMVPQLGQPFLTTKAGGSGLGLAIVKRIISAHQGTFSIDSTPELGTTVEVTLKRAAIAPQEGNSWG